MYNKGYFVIYDYYIIKCFKDIRILPDIYFHYMNFKCEPQQNGILIHLMDFQGHLTNISPNNRCMPKECYDTNIKYGFKIQALKNGVSNYAILYEAQSKHFRNDELTILYR